MKKMKRLMAVLLTLAMVLGMSVVTFAAPTLAAIKIPVSGDVVDGTEYQWLQLIEPDETTETGWKFSTATITDEDTPSIADVFKQTLGVTDEQDAIWKLIGGNGITKADQTLVDEIIVKIANGNYVLGVSASEITVSSAGMYYIKATAPEGANYIYNPMAAYVGFEYTDGKPAELKTDGVGAKGSKVETNKTSNVPTKVTEINEEVTYYVGSIVPDIPLAQNNRTYALTDTISGANYVLNDDKNVEITVYYGEVGTSLDTFIASVKNKEVNSDATTYYSKEVYDVLDPDTNEATGETGFWADLSTILDENAHANQPIVFSYKVKVTDTEVLNDAKVGKSKGTTEYGSDDEHLYTVKITINKKDESDNLLDGAKFVISKKEGDKTLYAEFDSNKFVEWVENTDTNAKYAGTELEAKDGTVTVEGLGEGTYQIIEVEAPQGYSINADIEELTVDVTTDTQHVTNGVATAVLEGEREVVDTTLLALPSTGGIGTTIFTIVGCLIMIAAAGLFFASRRKTEK